MLIAHHLLVQPVVRASTELLVRSDLVTRLCCLRNVRCHDASTTVIRSATEEQHVPNRILPDTESRSVAGHRAHSLVSLTPPFMDQKGGSPDLLLHSNARRRCHTGKNEFQTEWAGSRKNPRQGTCHRRAGWLKRQRLLSTTCCVNTSVIGHTRRRLFGRTHELCHSGHRVLGSGGPHVNLPVQPVTGVSSVNRGVVWVLVSPGNVCFIFLFIGSDCVYLQFACSFDRSMSTLNP